jgi:hypothetical protein
MYRSVEEEQKCSGTWLLLLLSMPFAREDVVLLFHAIRAITVPWLVEKRYE